MKAVFLRLKIGVENLRADSMFINLLFIGDVVGRPGRKIISETLASLKEELAIDMVICNAENSAGGVGITPKVAEELFKAGVDCITLGNHVWDRYEAHDLLDSNENILRPINYPEDLPGKGCKVFDLKNFKIGVINTSGRVFLDNVDCPFRKTEKAIEEMVKTTNIILIDFHAEATSEKLSFAWYFAGRVSAIVGTHTHVQTADECILSEYTAYITDVGMTGPINSVLGIKREKIIEKFLTGFPVKLEVSNNPPKMDAVKINIGFDGKAHDIIRINRGY